MKSTLRWLKRLGAGFLILCAIGIGYQQWGEQRDARDNPMPGRLIDVGDHRLHIWCIGQGKPTILMLAGSGTPSVASYPLQTRLAATSRTCSYDRAGLGWSDPPKRAMGLRQIVDDLDRLIAKSGEPGPFVLVPESFGGLIALAKARRDPDQVVGVVAVDASEPQSWHRISGPMRGNARVIDHGWQILWRIGVIRLLFDSQAPTWVNDMPSCIRRQFKAVWSRPMASYTTEWIDAYEQTPRADLPISRPGLLGKTPLIVISHGPKGGNLAKEFEDSWPEAQRRWTQLSTRSDHIIAKGNSHRIAQENPRLVAEAVARLVRDLRHAGSDGLYPPASSLSIAGVSTCGSTSGSLAPGL